MATRIRRLALVGLAALVLAVGGLGATGTLAPGAAAAHARGGVDDCC